MCAQFDSCTTVQRLQQQQKVDGFVQNQLVKTACSSLQQRYCTIETCRRQQPPEIDKLSMLCSGLCDIISFGEEDVGVSSLQFEEFSVATATIVESLMVSKDLRVVQSFLELEGTFEPGEQFSFGPPPLSFQYLPSTHVKSASNEAEDVATSYHVCILRSEFWVCP
ncbi:hypothetical protein Ancab_039324 [Ancistrocladus abbreviatus]